MTAGNKRFWILPPLSVAAFLAGRFLPAAVAGPPGVQVSGGQFAHGEVFGPAAAKTPQGWQPSADDLAKLMGAFQAIPTGGTLAEQEAKATVVEPAGYKELRHEILLKEIEKKYPSLAHDKVELLLRVNDRLADNKRVLRAAFQLGQITDDQYIVGLKNDVRAGVKEYAAKMTAEEYIKLTGWLPDKDPFDTTGSYQNPNAPHKTEEPFCDPSVLGAFCGVPPVASEENSSGPQGPPPSQPPPSEKP